MVTRSAQSAINPLLERIPYTELQKICNGQIVTETEQWYPEWVVQYVKKNRFVAPMQMRNTLQNDLSSHINIITAYLEQLKDRSQEIERFSISYLDFEVRDLLTRINAITRTQYLNPNDMPKNIIEMEKTHGPYIEGLVQTIASSGLDVSVIDKIGDMFRSEQQQMDDQSEDMLHLIDSLTDDLIAVNYKILEIFMQTNADSVYYQLSEKEVEILQAFYDQFSYLLEGEDIKNYIIGSLIGDENVENVLQGHFFVPDLFRELNSIKSLFTPVFNRDRLVTNYKSNFRLVTLHDASSRKFFSWDFMSLFDTQDGSLIDSKITKEVKEMQDQDTKEKRKIAKLHLILYKVYIFAGNDGTLHPSDANSRLAILRKLYRWVLDTKVFDEQTEEETEEEILNSNTLGYEVILPARKFRRNFLPLVSLICSYIPDCTMDLNQTKDKEIMVEKFTNFGNFEDLLVKPKLPALLDPALLKNLKTELGKNEFVKFTKQVDTLMDKFPEIKSPAKELPMMKEDPIQLLDNGQQPLGSLTDPKIQKHFDDKVGKKFLAVKSDDPHSPEVINLHNFINNIEGSDNPHKKTVMRTLLLKFIYSQYEQNPAASKTLVSVTLKYLIKKIRDSYSYSHVSGLRNFLVKTLDINDQFVPRDAEESLYHTLDVTFFVEFAMEDFAKRYQANPDNFPGISAETVKDRLLRSRQTITKSFLTINGRQVPDRMKIRKEAMSSNPLIIEKLPSFEFFVYFFDFFNYYTNIPETPSATYVSYHRVFRSFYSFLNQVRSQLVQDVENPYQYVLERLEHCLTYTENLQEWVKVEEQHTVCHFSHRKYAEMYFFYKVYLIDSQKSFRSGITEHSATHFNTHTRIFILFASEYSPFHTTLNHICQKHPDEALCISWSLYNNIILYLHTDKLSYGFLEGQIQEMQKTNDVPTKINIMNALEAAYLNVYNSNMVDWEKVNFLFDSINNGRVISIYKFLEFKQTEAVQLANYLKRTYSKLTVDKHEETLAATVQQILNGPENEKPEEDSLGTYLYHIDTFIPLYVKLFLQFANSEAQYLRIANLLIKNGISYDLIKLNDMRNDHFFMGLAKEVSNMKPQAALTTIRNRLVEKYDLIVLKSRAVTQNTFTNAATSEDEYDPLADLMGDISDNEDTMEKEHKQTFEKVVVMNIIEQSIQEKFNGSINKKELNRVEKTLEVVESKFNKNINLRRQESVSSMQDLDFTTDMLVFENDLVDTQQKKSQSILSGVRVDEEKLHTFDQMSGKMIDEVKEKMSNPNGKSPKTENKDSTVLSRSRSAERRNGKANVIVETLIKNSLKRSVSDYVVPLTRLQARLNKANSDKKLKIMRSKSSSSNEDASSTRPNRFNDPSSGRQKKLLI